MLNIATYSRNSQLLNGITWDKLDCIWWINLFFVVFCFKVIQFVLGPKSSRITVNMYDRRTPDRDLRRYGPIWVDRIESLVLEFNCESGDADVRGISMSGTYFRKKRIWIGSPKKATYPEKANASIPLHRLYSVVVIPVQTCVCKQIWQCIHFDFL